MNPAEFPASALEMYHEQINGHVYARRFRPIEAPACGERLDLDNHGLHLRCDEPKGHSALIKHRQVLPGDHPVYWCDDGCARRCTGPLSALFILRANQRSS